MSDAKKLAAEYLAIAAQVGGCGDGNCVIIQPTGMHTNGGCRCPRHMDAGQMIRLRALLRKGQHLARAALNPPSQEKSDDPR